MAIRISVFVDEERQRQSGCEEQDPAEILELLTASKDDGRPWLPSREYWLPFQDMTVEAARRTG